MKIIFFLFFFAIFNSNYSFSKEKYSPILVEVESYFEQNRLDSVHYPLYMKGDYILKVSNKEKIYTGIFNYNEIENLSYILNKKLPNSFIKIWNKILIKNQNPEDGYYYFYKKNFYDLANYRYNIDINELSLKERVKVKKKNCEEAFFLFYLGELLSRQNTIRVNLIEKEKEEKNFVLENRIPLFIIKEWNKRVKEKKGVFNYNDVDFFYNYSIAKFSTQKFTYKNCDQIYFLNSLSKKLGKNKGYLKVKEIEKPYIKEFPKNKELTFKNHLLFYLDY